MCDYGVCTIEKYISIELLSASVGFVVRPVGFVVRPVGMRLTLELCSLVPGSCPGLLHSVQQ